MSTVDQKVRLGKHLVLVVQNQNSIKSCFCFVFGGVKFYVAPWNIFRPLKIFDQTAHDSHALATLGNTDTGKYLLKNLTFPRGCILPS